MRILVLDPFYDTSHKQWAEGLQRHSSNQIDILSLDAHNWKWKMVYGAIKLAKQYQALDFIPDILLATDMLDLNTFISLVNIDRSKTTIALYFHENQITYPWPISDNELKEKNNHYGFINFRSCLCADQIFFNSTYHHSSFLKALPSFLKIFPSFGALSYVNKIAAKSQIMPLGMELSQIMKEEKLQEEIPTFLWNHRWEYDKNPELFFKTLFLLFDQGFHFNLIVLGKSYKRQPEIFKIANEKLSDRILHFGFVESTENYIQLMSKANILMVTSNQDFFGISTVEGIAHGLYPILPNRLAYPEHIPVSHHKEIFYQNEEELLSKTKEVLNKKKYLRSYGFQEFVKKYNWEESIEIYDRQFESLRNGYI